MAFYQKVVNRERTRSLGTARRDRTRWSASECLEVRRWRSNAERYTPLHKHIYCMALTFIHCAQKKTLNAARVMRQNRKIINW